MAALATIQEAAFVVIALFCVSFECVQRNMELVKYRASPLSLSLSRFSLYLNCLLCCFVSLSRSLSVDFCQHVRWMGIRAGQVLVLFSYTMPFQTCPNKTKQQPSLLLSG